MFPKDLTECQNIKIKKTIFKKAKSEKNKHKKNAVFKINEKKRH